MRPYPDWLYLLAWAYLLLCFLSALWITSDLLRGHRQRMAIMNVVWPVTALYFGPFAVWMYFRTRPLSTGIMQRPSENEKRQLENLPPTFEQVAVAVFHCGAGCTVGDVIAEYGLYALGGATFLAGSEFATKLFVDFLLAYAFGIVFQYLTIAPMRGLGLRDGIVAAARADTISITAFEVGMFLWMRLTRFVFFPEPHRIYPNLAVFWFMMQIAMILGWATSYPANVWLIRREWKEKMPQYSSLQQRARHELPSRVV